MDTVPCQCGWRSGARPGEHHPKVRVEASPFRESCSMLPPQLSHVDSCHKVDLIKCLVIIFGNEQAEEMERHFSQSQCGFWRGEHRGT